MNKDNILSHNYKIPLFDIDWTLLEGSNTVHKAGFRRAFKVVYSLPSASVDEIEHHGMIDSQILMEIAKLHGVSDKEAKNKVNDAMTVVVDYFMKHVDEGKYQPMRGVVSLLKKLKNLSIPLGLLTGNIEEIGWEKVRRAGIKDFFTFGAFGSIALKRVALIPIAKKRLGKILGQEIPLERFVIVGDSPLDIACGRDGGIPVIAVGTGHYKTHELTNADLVVESLEEKDKLLKFLGI